MKTLLLLLLLPLVSACEWDNPVSPPLPAERTEAALKTDTLMVAVLCPRPGTPAADSLGVSCTVVTEGGN